MWKSADWDGAIGGGLTGGCARCQEAGDVRSSSDEERHSRLLPDDLVAENGADARQWQDAPHRGIHG